jgi:hypothetical protein
MLLTAFPRKKSHLEYHRTFFLIFSRRCALPSTPKDDSGGTKNNKNTNYTHTSDMHPFSVTKHDHNRSDRKSKTSGMTSPCSNSPCSPLPVWELEHKSDSPAAHSLTSSLSIRWTPPGVQKKVSMSRVWWHTPIMPALQRVRQEDAQLQASLGHAVRLCLKKLNLTWMWSQAKPNHLRPSVQEPGWLCLHFFHWVEPPPGCLLRTMTLHYTQDNSLGPA